MSPAGPETWLLAAVLLVCLGFVPVLALFSSMGHLARGNLRLARFTCVAALAGAGLQWLALFAGAFILSPSGPSAPGPDTFGWILRLPLPLLILLGMAAVTTLGSVVLNARIEREERRREGRDVVE